ncbi:transcriptional regulator, AraC family protein [Plesiocystis pacifica SIR-1]|uniref:Transcriptional regulator, AraC family protein n=1 Tax=Plesiocystis pacifica SIR-1 TaxID=391625 RepID=A6FZ93_9BACT|nr:AraC family transcriptional regulator [Plesiocystis pacifica]EDM80977.1 transcriptional regulator, AraC family protein [Plesiocystis pacifica SIR-1]
MDQDRLRALVERHAGPDGLSATPIAGLSLFRVNQPVERLPAVYPASMCCVAQGSKRAYLGGVAYTYDADHYLCVAMPLPVEAEVPVASPDEPVLGVLLDLDTPAMAETLVAYEAAARPRSASTRALSPGLAVVEADAAFLDAVVRLLELLDNPVALRVLAKGRMRELLFTILAGQAGPLMRQSFGAAQDITRVLHHIREHLHDPLSVDELAQRAGMSRAVFHRRFRAATSFSPLQFIKALRLSHAAMLIVGGQAVSQAADAVGYTSASQFSREFRKHFGDSPRRWAKTTGAAPLDVQAAGG